MASTHFQEDRYLAKQDIFTVFIAISQYKILRATLQTSKNRAGLNAAVTGGQQPVT